MAKKLAITISGAVSLGSYESGVVFEVLDALSQHNRWCAENGQPDKRIEIDVLTGASAGGMTAAMIAQRLLFDGPAMDTPYSNPLYDAWVKDVDISGLLARQPDEDVTHSILSSDLVIGISKKYLTARYTTQPQPPPAPQAHLALSSDRALRLGLAISNLNGVDYCRPTQSGGEFSYTSHEDQFVRTIEQASGDRYNLWESIRATAVACGAFPVAFRVQDLVRNIDEYPRQYLAPGQWGGNQCRYFTYTDGGVFQNEPLGMAKNLVDKMPRGHLDADQRGYLFIAPHPKQSSDVHYTTDPKADPSYWFGAANANYKALLPRLAESVMGQAEFQDWVTAEGVNEKLQLLDDRARQLQEMFRDGTLTAAATKPVSSALLLAFALPDLEAARTQLRHQYAVEHGKFEDATTANAWLDAVLVLELAANLHEKEEMLIYDFVADPKQLASNQLEAFEGFFDVSYRKHDYDYGRSVAQDKLKEYRTPEKSVFFELQWEPSQIDPIDPNLDNLAMSKVDVNKRKKVYKQISKAADDLLAELDLNVLERKLVMFLVIKGKIKEMLSLDPWYKRLE